MRKIDDSLYNYLKCKYGKEMWGVIKKFKLDTILVDRMEELPLCEYTEVLGLIKERKIKQILMINEMINLSETFEARGIKLIHMKGLSLAADLYNFTEKRKGNDIDVLVDFDDAAEALDILYEFNYLNKSTGDPVTRELVDLELGKIINQRIHFTEFKKEIPLGKNKYTIYMDLHLSIFHKIENKIEVMKDIVSNSVMEPFYGTYIRVLEPHDRLIHLLLHFAKEYVQNDLKWRLMGLRKNSDGLPKYRCLHDVALFLDKYSSKLNWNYFFIRVQEWRKCTEVLLPLLLVNEIYSNILPIDILEKLKSNQEQYEYDSVWSAINRIQPEVIINKEPYETYIKMLDVFGHLYTKEMICERFDERFDDTNHHFQTQSNSNEYAASGDFKWDIDHLYMNLQVEDSTFDRQKGLNFQIFLMDSEFRSKETFPIKRLYIRPIHDSNKIEFRITPEHFDINYGLEYEHEYSLTLHREGCSLFIAIPWSLLEINPEINKMIRYKVRVGRELSITQLPLLYENLILR